MAEDQFTKLGRKLRERALKAKEIENLQNLKNEVTLIERELINIHILFRTEYKSWPLMNKLPKVFEMDSVLKTKSKIMVSGRAAEKPGNTIIRNNSRTKAMKQMGKAAKNKVLAFVNNLNPPTSSIYRINQITNKKINKSKLPISVKTRLKNAPNTLPSDGNTKQDLVDGAIKEYEEMLKVKGFEKVNQGVKETLYKLLGTGRGVNNMRTQAEQAVETKKLSETVESINETKALLSYDNLIVKAETIEDLEKIKPKIKNSSKLMKILNHAKERINMRNKILSNNTPIKEKIKLLNQYKSYTGARQNRMNSLYSDLVEKIKEMDPYSYSRNDLEALFKNYNNKNKTNFFKTLDDRIEKKYMENREGLNTINKLKDYKTKIPVSIEGVHMAIQRKIDLLSRVEARKNYKQLKNEIKKVTDEKFKSLLFKKLFDKVKGNKNVNIATLRELGFKNLIIQKESEAATKIQSVENRIQKEEEVKRKIQKMSSTLYSKVFRSGYGEGKQLEKILSDEDMGKILSEDEKNTIRQIIKSHKKYRNGMKFTKELFLKAIKGEPFNNSKSPPTYANVVKKTPPITIESHSPERMNLLKEKIRKQRKGILGLNPPMNKKVPVPVLKESIKTQILKGRPQNHVLVNQLFPNSKDGYTVEEIYNILGIKRAPR